MTKWRRWTKYPVSTKPLFDDLSVPTGKIPPVCWYCHKLKKSSTDINELSQLNGNCPGCIIEDRTIGKCKENPHKNGGIDPNCPAARMSMMEDRI